MQMPLLVESLREKRYVRVSLLQTKRKTHLVNSAGNHRSRAQNPLFWLSQIISQFLLISVRCSYLYWRNSHQFERDLNILHGRQWKQLANLYDYDACKFQMHTALSQYHSPKISAKSLQQFRRYHHFCATNQGEKRRIEFSFFFHQLTAVKLFLSSGNFKDKIFLVKKWCKKLIL